MRPCGFSRTPVDEDQIAAFLAPYAITVDEFVSRMGAEM